MKHLILIILYIICNIAIGQPCQPKIIELAMDSAINDANIIQTNDGNYLVGGSFYKNHFNYRDLFLIKMDYNGTFLWSLTLGDSFVVSCPKIMETRDGNYLISYNTQNYAYKSSILLKLNNNGLILWQQKIDNANNCQIEDILEEANGELIAVGSKYSAGQNGAVPNIVVLRLDALGKTINGRILNIDISEKTQYFNPKDSTWHDTAYFYPGHGQAYSLTKTKDGNYLVGGFNNQYPELLPEIGGPLLFKMDFKFQVLWQQSYPNDAINKQYPINISEDSDRNIFLGIRDIYQGVDGGVSNIVYRVDSAGVFTKKYYPGVCGNTIVEFHLNQKNQFELAGMYGMCKTDTTGKMISRSFYSTDFKIELNGRNTYVDHSNNEHTFIGIKSNRLCLIKYGYFGDDCLTYIKGKVYEDKNKNCHLDTSEQNIFLWGNFYNCRSIVTDTAGNYIMESEYGDNYSYADYDSKIWKIGCEGSDKNLVHFDYPQSIKDSINIGLFSNLDTCFYFEKYFNVSSRLNCTKGSYYYSMYNFGDSTIKNLDLFIEMPLLSFDFSSNYTFTQLGNSLHFKFDSLARREYLQVVLKDSISCNAEPGDTLCYRAKLEFQRTCPDMKSVYLDSFCRIIRNSHDPNYIEGYIRNNETCFDGKTFRNPLNYTIHFQNTGNAPASKVIIIDTLRFNLDKKSFKKGIASHPYMVEQKNDSILIFTFDPIFLPDSTSDAEASKGFVEFDIYGYFSDLNIHKSIQQQASIYFDQNLPIQTPIHAFEKCITTGIKDLSTPGFKFNIYPNPTRDYFLVECNLDVYDLKFFDMNGKLIISKSNIREPIHRVELNHMKQGTYYVQIITGKRTDWKKLILMNVD